MHCSPVFRLVRLAHNPFKYTVLDGLVQRLCHVTHPAILLKLLLDACLARHDGSTTARYPMKCISPSLPSGRSSLLPSLLVARTFQPCPVLISFTVSPCCLQCKAVSPNSIKRRSSPFFCLKTNKNRQQRNQHTSPSSSSSASELQYQSFHKASANSIRLPDTLIPPILRQLAPGSSLSYISNVVIIDSSTVPSRRKQWWFC